MSGVMNGTQIVLKVISTAISNVLGLGTADDPVSKDYTQLLSNGTGANQVSQQWHDQRTLGASASENIDIQAGTFKNAFGVAIAFTKIKAMIIKAAAGNTNDVIVGAQGANAWLGMLGQTTATIKVKPGGVFAWIAPDVNGGAVAAGDLLKILNGGAGTGVTYDITIIGTD